MRTRFFLERPIFAWVLAIAIMLWGALSLRQLPVAQYPNVAPPRVMVSAYYPGAAAEALENSVTQVLEQQLKGLDGLLYFTSQSNADGSCEIAITFAQGVDVDAAQVQVQNKLQQALGRLPLPVQQQGLAVNKAQSDILMVMALWDGSDRRSSRDLSDYLVSSLQDPLSRIPGVGNLQVFGSQYAMRIWLDPYKLAARKLMPSDVIAAIRAQNAQVIAGELGAQPALAGQQLNATVTSQSRLRTVAEFQAIALRAEPHGPRLLLGDVARVELGSESYGAVTRLNGHPASGLAVMLAPGANALDTARAVRARVAELARSLPSGVHVSYPLDVTAFVEHSIREVVETLLIAIGLVVLVMYVFLRSWRAALIPALAIPVVLLGTFGVLSLFGFSINTLTMFGMVLAIGLLVDDAIVVVENVERLMAEHGLTPKEATARSLEEISSALVGIGLVLSAVFLPMAFFGGSTGVIYQQFSITIVSSMLLSVLVALTLSPAMCASLLRPRRGSAHDHAHVHVHAESRFERALGRMTAGYVRGVRATLARPARFFAVYLALCAGLYLLMTRLPTSFLPGEDQAQTIVQFTLPVGATQQRTLEVAKAVERYFMTAERNNVADVFTVTGTSFSGTGQNVGMGFVQLKPWELRTHKRDRAQNIAVRASVLLAQVRDAEIFAVTPPAVMGLGQTNGFTFQLLDDAGQGRAQLKAARERLLELAAHDRRLDSVRYSGMEDTPQLYVDFDQAKLGALGLSHDAVNDTLAAAWGGSYVNDFIDRGRVKRVYVQGDAAYRARPEDLGAWFVRGESGAMTPFSSFATTRWQRGPQTLGRFNGVAAYELQGEAAEGESSGEAMRVMEQLKDQLPGRFGHAWSGLSYQERLSTGQAGRLYALSILVVFLCLAALFESWSIPLSILLTLPLGVLGAALFAALRGLHNDVFFQVALITTLGLSAKNAILIVEFAASEERAGRTPHAAALTAASMRLRPILMTSLAFVAGVAPLAFAHGAGANGRIAIGTGVIGGVLTGTVLSCLFVPLFFVWLRRVRRPATHAPAAPSALTSPAIEGSH